MENARKETSRRWKTSRGPQDGEPAPTAVGSHQTKARQQAHQQEQGPQETTRQEKKTTEDKPIQSVITPPAEERRLR